MIYVFLVLELISLSSLNAFQVVDMVFGNGHKYSLSPENYMFRHSKNRGAYCLGIFQNGKDPTTLLGGIVVRNTLVMYDCDQTKVGFWKTNCAELWERLQISVAPPPMPPNTEVRNSAKSFEPSVAPAVSQHDVPLGEFQIAQITISISFNISCVDLKPHLTELAGLIPHELDVNTSQSIIALLAEHRMQLPATFGSYKLVDWSVDSPSKRNWWQRHYMVVGLTIMLTLLLGCQY